MKYLRIDFVLYTAILLATACKKDGPAGTLPTSSDGSTMGPLPPSSGRKVVVSTIAGNGSRGLENGPSLAARFNSPTDVAVASDGSLYVSDYSNHCIRKITGGQVSTFAGTGDFGIVNGTGSSAQFKFPYQVALDANNNLYILDEGITAIRQITPTAFVAEFAGMENPGFLNGPALIARFQNDEEGIIADPQGNLYVSDTFNGRIRKIAIGGEVTTFAGNGTVGFRDGDSTDAEFMYPSGIAFDQSGNLFVADQGNFCIRKITPDGAVSKFAGGQYGNNDGHGTSAQFNFLNDMVSDRQGNLYVADDNRIRMITSQGDVHTIAGSTEGYVDGDGARAKFAGIGGLGIDTNGNIFVADIKNNRIREISFR